MRYASILLKKQLCFSSCNPFAFSEHLNWYFLTLCCSEVFVFFCCLLILAALRGGLGVGDDSKQKWKDWYSSQSMELLLRALSKPNVNGPLKPVCSCLLKKNPHQCVGRVVKKSLANQQSNKENKQFKGLASSKQKSSFYVYIKCFIKFNQDQISTNPLLWQGGEK